MHADVAILGTGPAGVAAALCLRRHAPHLCVTLWTGPHRLASGGETLPPNLLPLLRSLGLDEAVRVRGFEPCFASAAAWGGPQPEANEFMFHPEGLGWHLDRDAFDAILLEAALARGVRLAEGIPEAWSRSEGRWQDSRGAGPRAVLDATGRRALFASRQGARRLHDDRLVAVGIRCDFSKGGVLPGPLVEAVPFGWWYSCPSAQGGYLACMTDADLAREMRLREPEGFRAALKAAPFTARRIGAAPPGETPRLRAADSGLLDAVTGDGWLAAGDAASTVDPLSSAGIGKALRQGMVAGYALADHLRGDARALPKYESWVRAEHLGFLEARSEVYARERRWPSAPFWRRRTPIVPAAPSLERETALAG